MEIRLAESGDINALMDIYESARAFMARTGNPRQWIDGYPSRSVVVGDIDHGCCHVLCLDSGEIVAVFSLIYGPDPTYADIYGGNWVNDTAPYATVHRLASSGRLPGAGRRCMEWCCNQCANLRADTHEDNRIMQQILEDLGFKKCGIILTHNHTPRIAYQRYGNFG